MEKIEACPFCGGEGKLKDTQGRQVRQGWVGCPECGLYISWKISPDGAVRKWNQRTRAADSRPCMRPDEGIRPYADKGDPVMEKDRQAERAMSRLEERLGTGTQAADSRPLRGNGGGSMIKSRRYKNGDACPCCGSCERFSGCLLRQAYRGDNPGCTARVAREHENNQEVTT